MGMGQDKNQQTNNTIQTKQQKKSKSTNKSLYSRPIKLNLDQLPSVKKRSNYDLICYFFSHEIFHHRIIPPSSQNIFTDNSYLHDLLFICLTNGLSALIQLQGNHDGFFVFIKEEYEKTQIPHSY